MKYIMKAKSIDIFGQKVNFNFGKIGETFNTPYGIIISILIFLLVGMYSGFRSYVLILRSESNVSSVSQPINIVNDLGKVYLN
jgi:hypothetical protein